ncbi:MAG: hypothetical protein OXD01_11215 [Gammaproteobacteria bacterium]|nr:hypothetical protein [Gammaproteobacteria bacterium]
MICEHEISDIFEIKFCPWWYPNYKIDEKKLLEYGGEHDVRLKNPYSVDSDNVLYDRMQISKNCKRHFVAVGRSNSDAVMLKNISRDIIHWYGKIEQSPEGNCWDISKGERGKSATMPSSL